MATMIFGTSDDLIEIEGEVRGEVSCEGNDSADRGVMIICSDGTLLEVKYGKADMAIWEIKLLSAGTLFDHIDPCMDEDAEIYSDVAHFNDGLKWAYAATEWQRMR